jgi:uncharacterized protein YqeY
MRSGDALRRDVLRMATNSIYNAEKRDRRTYSEDELVVIVTKEVKTRRESIEAFRAGGREDLAAKEAAEIEILLPFLPQQLGQAELELLVDQAVAETGATSARDMGRVMGVLAPRTRGRAVGKELAALVVAALARVDLARHDADHGQTAEPTAPESKPTDAADATPAAPSGGGQPGR